MVKELIEEGRDKNASLLINELGKKHMNHQIRLTERLGFSEEAVKRLLPNDNNNH